MTRKPTPVAGDSDTSAQPERSPRVSAYMAARGRAVLLALTQPGFLEAYGEALRYLDKLSLKVSSETVQAEFLAQVLQPVVRSLAADGKAAVASDLIDTCFSFRIPGQPAQIGETPEGAQARKDMEAELASYETT